MTTALGLAMTPEWRAKHQVELLAKPYTPTAMVETIQQMLTA